MGRFFLTVQNTPVGADVSEHVQRWVLELRGDDSELASAAAIYGAEADPQITKFGDGANAFYGMTSAQFSMLSRPREVHEIGLRLLGIINGILFIRDDRRRALTLGNVRQQNANGGWNYVLIAETGYLELRGYPPTVTVSGAPHTPPPYLAWTTLANSDDRVAEVLIELSGDPDWFSIYNAFEVMRVDINERFGQHKQTNAGWPEKAKLDFFTESATVYRHSSEKWGRYNPQTAMTLRDGQQFVRELAAIWLAAK